MPFEPPKPIIVALGIALIGHACLLLVPIMTEPASTRVKQTRFKLTLKPAEPARISSRPEDMQQPEPLQEQEDKQNPAEAQPDLQPLPIASADRSNKQQTSELDQDELVSSVVTIIRHSDASVPRRGFGLEQLKPKAPLNYGRQSLVQGLATIQTANRSSTSSAGQSTDLLRGPNGKAACWQQRGTPGGPQQWYRVPRALCGHLENAK